MCRNDKNVKKHKNNLLIQSRIGEEQLHLNRYIALPQANIYGDGLIHSAVRGMFVAVLIH